MLVELSMRPQSNSVSHPITSLVYSIGNDFCLEGSPDLQVTVTLYCNPIPIIPSHVLIWKLDAGPSGLIPLPNAAVSGITINGSTLIAGPANLTIFEMFSFICRVVNPTINAFHDERTSVTRCGECVCMCVCVHVWLADELRS